jgi:hypothetical protein
MGVEVGFDVIVTVDTACADPDSVKRIGRKIDGEIEKCIVMEDENFACNCVNGKEEM